MIAKSQKIVEVQVELLPCCECGSTNLDLFNCGYSAFNVAGVDCKNCDNKMHLNNVSWNISDVQIAKSWNKENDLDINIAQIEKTISNLRTRIKELKKMKRKYAHKT